MDYYQSRINRKGVVWGCTVHRTPRGTECHHCDRQGELFTRPDVIPRPRPANPRPARILITGSRTWTDRTTIAQSISDYLKSTGTSIGGAWPFPVIVHGTARGADQLADAIARTWGWTPEGHPANWLLYGKAAGMKRNAAMVAAGADVCLAFIRDDSPGATQAAALAEAAGIPTIRYRSTSADLCRGCGLYPDEHCPDCGQCPDWHEPDCVLLETSAPAER